MCADPEFGVCRTCAVCDTSDLHYHPVLPGAQCHVIRGWVAVDGGKPAARSRLRRMTVHDGMKCADYGQPATAVLCLFRMAGNIGLNRKIS